MDFVKFCDDHHWLIYEILQTAQDHVNMILGMDFLEMDPIVETTLMHSAFFRECRRRERDLKNEGFQIVQTRSSNEKRWLYHAKDNVIIRFGKMTDKAIMAKCQTYSDKNFAEQSDSLFPELPFPLHVHAGYTTDAREITFTDMIFAIPKDATSNQEVWKYSENGQTRITPLVRKTSGNGFKDKLLAGAEKIEEYGSGKI